MALELYDKARDLAYHQSNSSHVRQQSSIISWTFLVNHCAKGKALKACDLDKGTVCFSVMDFLIKSERCRKRHCWTQSMILTCQMHYFWIKSHHLTTDGCCWGWPQMRYYCGLFQLETINMVLDCNVALRSPLLNS